MRAYRIPWMTLLVVLLSVLFVAPAIAQEEDDPPDEPTNFGRRHTGFVFNLGPAGARALGLGGTFIGFADDATAAVANPAGLVQLDEAELSLNVKGTRSDHEAAVDFTGGMGSFSDTFFSPTFLGFAQPFGDGAWALYFHEERTQIHSSASDDDRPVFFVCCDFFVDEDLDIDNKVRTFGASIAYEFDGGSIGASLGLARLDWDQRRFLTFTEAASPTDALILDISHTNADSTSLKFDAGVLFNPDGAFSLGLVYKMGPKFSLVRVLSPSCEGFSSILCSPENYSRDEHDLNLPSEFGAGLKFGGGALRAGADIRYVTYSDLADAFEFIFGFPSDDPMEDQVEINAGAEYAFGDEGGSRGFVRAGAFRIPDHDGLSFIDSDRVGVALGGGGIFEEGLQLDVGLSISESFTEFGASLGYRFR